MAILGHYWLYFTKKWLYLAKVGRTGIHLGCHKNVDSQKVNSHNIDSQHLFLLTNNNLHFDNTVDILTHIS